MRVMVAGDWHGNTKHAINLINKAGELKIQHIVQVGDFGLWTHYLEGHLFLDEIQDAARANNLSIYAVGGNHENWDHWNFITANMPGSKGFAAVRSRVLLAPKVNGWKWAGKTFGSAGGAVSVDRESRLYGERGGVHMTEGGFMMDFGKGTGPKTQYWPNERFTDEDLERYKRNVGKVDYLFSHDCSDYTPFTGNHLKPDMESKFHRQRMDNVIANSQATMHFHGHMHTRYDWENSRSHGFYEPGEDARSTRTIGLEADPAAMRRRNGAPGDSWGVLEVESGQWLWPDEVDASVERRRAAKEAAVAERISRSGLSASEL